MDKIDRLGRKYVKTNQNKTNETTKNLTKGIKLFPSPLLYFILSVIIIHVK